MIPRFLAIATIAASLAVPAMAAQDSDQSGNNIDPKGLSSQQVKDLQQALKDKGDLNGQVDGVWGPQSAQALKAFQKDQSIKGAKGQLDDQTISALGLNQSEFQNGENGGASTSAGGSAPTGISSTNSSSSYGSGNNASSPYNSSTGSNSTTPNATSPNSSSTMPNGSQSNGQ